MSIDINELSTAYTLCTCGQVCTRQCTVCNSVSWQDGPCVRQLWEWHIQDNKVSLTDVLARTTLKWQMPEHVSPPERPTLYTRDDLRFNTNDGSVSLRRLTDDQIVERCIDVMEQSGMSLERWQIQAMRAIFGTHA